MRRIICPNCGSKVFPKKEACGPLMTGVITGIILILEFITLTGISYFATMGRFRYRCPKCGMTMAAKNRKQTPMLKTWVAQKRNP